ncbi:MAG: carboxylating nicotinate-nucleotide diphosphorylase [Actinomycetota bacterium]|nr:carboxylating nicotinate-nucleotide diphosphorylase [Actinomycetota bacterium]
MATVPRDVNQVIRRALDEDLGPGGDITSRAVVAEGAVAGGRFEGRAGGVVAGLPVAERVFRAVDPRIEVSWEVADGDPVGPDTVLGEVRGPGRSILAAERVALNFLTHLSGVATLTRRFVDACSGTASVVLCTRKTLPGLRSLERYAVEAGGGRLHRFGLSDGVLIKDNHVRLAGGVREAVRRARAGVPHGLRVEVEVETLEELEEALGAGADAVLLDNADLDTVKRAVDLAGDRVPLEVSGGVALERIAGIAGAGRLLISVGRITHSAPALDISLELWPEP